MPAKIRPKSESSKLNRLFLGGESATNQHRDSDSEKVIYSTSRSLLPARIYGEPQDVRETLPDHINERRLSAGRRQGLSLTEAENSLVFGVTRPANHITCMTLGQFVVTYIMGHHPFRSQLFQDLGDFNGAGGV